jgi:lambda family phage minor tail protein L
MPRNPSGEFITRKNAEVNKPIFLYVIYNWDGASNNLYYTNHKTNITYNGQVYTKFPGTHEAIGENTTGEIDTVRFTLGNATRVIGYYLENYEWRGKKVSIIQVFADKLDDASANITDTYYIDSYSTTKEGATFILTSKFDILNVVLPARRYSRNYCGWKFKSTECGYSGAETECNKTLARCRILSNSERFGGFPSIPSKRMVLG